MSDDKQSRRVFRRSPAVKSTKNKKAKAKPKGPAKPLLIRMPVVAVFEDDWRARPTPERPYPVVLIHGTGTTKSDWAQLGLELRDLGFAVYAPDFGHRATAPLAESAEQVAAYMDALLTITAAEKVILVGHSQGGLLARMWAAQPGNAGRVHQIISLSTPHFGTRPGGIIAPMVRTEQASRTMNTLINGIFGPAAKDMLGDSELLAELNEDGGGILPGVVYSNIATRSDTIVQPVESCFLEGENCVNLFVQGEKTFPLIRHDEMPFHRLARAATLEQIRAHHPVPVEIAD